MKKIFYKRFALFTMGVLLLGACAPKLDPVTASKADLDLSKYIAVGNSLTAGIADNGLYNESIANSYPGFIAEQFKLVGGGEFNQPFFDDAQKNGTGYLAITGWSPTGTPVISQVSTQLALTPNGLAPFVGERNNNLGISGIRVVDVTVPIYSQLNPFFQRLLPALTAKSYVDFVGESNPTFFTCWIGNNDVLGFASSGGDPAANPIRSNSILPSQFPFSTDGSLGAITNTNVFNASFDALINRLTANGAKGALATIPDIASVPYVTLVNGQIRSTFPTFPFLPRSAAEINVRREFTAADAGLLNAIYQGLSVDPDGPGPMPTIPGWDPDGAGPIVGGTNPGFTAGNNRFVIVKEVAPSNTLPTSICPLCPADPPGALRVIVEQMDAASDFILLPAQQGLLTPANFANGLGFVNPTTFQPLPFPDWAILDEAEVNLVRNSTNAFNAKIRAAAQAKGLAVVEADALFNEIIRTGRIDGVAVTTAFVSGGLFSLDGVHLTPRGNAIVANQFIKAINAKYGSSVPRIDINARNIRGVLFP